MDRKDFFGKGLKELAGNILKSPVGKVVDQQLGGLANLLSPQWLEGKLGSDEGAKNKPPKTVQNSLAFPRPPGALTDPEAFEKACTRCNDCLMACPHGSLFTLGPYSGPMINPNVAACYLCEDYPCIKSCEAGALLPLDPDTLPSFGEPVFYENRCINHPEVREEKMARAKKKRMPYCTACVSSCPVEDAIAWDEKKMPEFYDYCTGCGVCTKVCPVIPKAIEIDYSAKPESEGG